MMSSIHARDRNGTRRLSSASNSCQEMTKDTNIVASPLTHTQYGLVSLETIVSLLGTPILLHREHRRQQLVVAKRFVSLISGLRWPPCALTLVTLFWLL
jgi:hypothetical protein